MIQKVPATVSVAGTFCVFGWPGLLACLGGRRFSLHLLAGDSAIEAVENRE